MTPLDFKIICIVGTFIGGLLGLCAILMKKSTKDQSRFLQCVSYANAFGGGVILAVGLMHMLSDASSDMADLYGDYPYAFLMAAVGYMVVYALEDILVKKLLKRNQVNLVGHLVHTHGGPPGTHGTHQKKSDDMESSLSFEQSEDNKDNKNLVTKGSDNIPKKLVVSLCLLLALSFHSFFAGLSLGVETDLSQITATLIAIIAHKSVAALVLCNSMLQSNMSQLKVVILMVIFSSTTPIGIGVGMAVSSLSDNVTALSAWIVSFSAGTFLYLGTVILKDQPDRCVTYDVNGNPVEPKYKAGELRRLALWILGAAIMAVAAIWS